MAYKQIIKVNGQELEIQSNNCLYSVLNDIDLLYEKLKTMHITQLAKELQVPQNSIRFRVHKYFPLIDAEWEKNIVKGRKYHRNRHKVKAGS